MTVTINGSSGIDAVQPGTIAQADLATNVAGNGPAFTVSRVTSNQSVTSAAYTKVQLNQVDFQTSAGSWDAGNFRFNPQVAGYYFLYGTINAQGAGAITEVIATLYKNGAETTWGDVAATTGIRVSAQTSGLIYLNGTTDYVELFGYVAATTPVILAGSSRTFFSGFLARAA